MDLLLRSRQIPAELFAYAENKKIFEIFQNIVERLSVDRPEDPVEYVFNLLVKQAVYNVPKVYILGPPTIDRTMIATLLDLKLNLAHITIESIYESLYEKERVNEFIEMSDLVEMIKDRLEKPDCARRGWILEGFPNTRTESFMLRKAGIFPTHIVLVEPHDLAEMSTEDMSDEMKDYLGHEMLILDFHRNSHIKKFIVDCDVEATIDKVLDFVRSKKQPPLPYLPRVLLLGPYGSGRKTVAKKLAQKYNLIEVSFQQELRKAAVKSSPVKEKICRILESSSPIPDDVLSEVASERLMQKDCIERGWVMYYFPDTAKQAKFLAKSLEGFQINRAIFLNARLQNCLDRVEPRRLDPDSGIVYHLKLNPCENKEIEDRLIQLPRDSAEMVEAEYRFFEGNVEQMKIFFQQDFSDDISTDVDANQSECEVFEAVQGALLKSTKMKLESKYFCKAAS